HLDQVYRTSTSTSGEPTQAPSWHEGFEFRISFHAQLFGTLQLDLYSSRWLLPDVHVGRSSLRINLLEGLPQAFVSWFELWEPRYADADKARSATMYKPTTSPTSPTFRVSNLGATRLRLHYQFQQRSLPKTPTARPRSLSTSSSSESPPSGYLHSPGEDQEIYKVFQERVSVLRERKEEENEESPAYSEDTDTHQSMSREVPQSKGHEREDSNGPGSFMSSFFFSSSSTTTTSSSTISSSSPPSSITGGVEGMTSGEKDDGAEGGDNGLLNSLGEYFVNPETKRNLRAITSMVRAFGQGFDISYVELLNGAALLERFYSTIDSDRTGSVMEGYEECERAAHFHRFALASYGWKGLNFFGHGNGILTDSIRSHSDIRSIREFLGLEEDDLLMYDLHGRVIFRPNYYVALDRATNSIILAVRGTMSAMDTLTDLVCEYQPWRNGLVHSGMKAAAQWFLTEVFPSVLLHCERLDVTDVVLVGHSLGAGTASILAMLLQGLHPKTGSGKEVHIRCMAYGPPCIASEEFLNQNDGIQSFILGEDIVARLSYGSCMDVRSMLVVASELAHGGVSNLISYGVRRTRRR
ncbi:hypothetical protein BJ684DRAFT_11152, partial [Piptocephalis cylindrospora]